MSTTGIFIIPLHDLLRELEPFEELFGFYRDGLKGVVRDALPLVDGRRVIRHRANRMVSEWESSSFPMFLDKVSREYENSADAIVARFMENTTAGPIIELVLEKIWRTVQLVMSDMFSFVPVTVDDTEGCWLGNDFVAWVTLHDTFHPSGL